MLIKITINLDTDKESCKKFKNLFDLNNHYTLLNLRISNNINHILYTINKSLLSKSLLKRSSQ